MPVSRRKYNALRVSLRKRWHTIFQLLREVRDLAQDLRREREARLKAEQEAKRLDERVARLEALLRTAGQDQGAEAVQLNRRIERLTRRCAGYRAELAAEREKPGGSALELANRSRRSLAKQLEMVQRSNDYMSQQLADAAGTPAAKKPAGREPGVVS
ncbi:hypothetical protein [Streptomyces abikoensis]|uniref:hypothetical protein n=1 Tax=Streptomyces abikoensis TaxID=97398 RepID=UPI00167A1CB9|nr:hypothetical protein [Streptomyces abikoensis]GGP55576.1 hypothetical protein GCM10010214_30960 [Streptomyces abikoensis]